jgi:8-oxo-dGTP pyrophosphatase MutT (NUDIX family)
MKKRYVLCFAHQIPFYQMQRVVLIERKKADWQLGRLNLPGGSIQEGETPEQAAVRELREETGLVASLADTRLLGEMEGEDWYVAICFCPYRNWHNGKEQVPETMCDEGTIHELVWREVMNDPRLIPNLRLIIPLCMSRLAGWKLIPAGAPGDGHTWVTVLGDITTQTAVRAA